MWRKRDSDTDQPIEEVSQLDTTVIGGLSEGPSAIVEAPRQLALLAEAQRILSEATSLDEIKDIRDKAEAARKYVESAQLGLAMQNHAAEVKLRAERRAGELLKSMNLAGGDRRSKQASDGLSLDDLGISKHQSSRWQREATVPEQAFERFLREAKESQQELTTVSLLRLARQFTAKRSTADDAVEPVTTLGAIYESFESLRALENKFPCVYADPAWPKQASTDFGVGRSLDELCALPVAELIADDAHLHLWVGNDQLFEAPRLMAAWGFEFQSCLVWVRPQRGRGEFWRISHEFLLLGTCGSLPFRDRSLISWVRVNRSKRSRKPERIRKLIERVSPGPYLELFGASPVRGWTVASRDIAR